MSGESITNLDRILLHVQKVLQLVEITCKTQQRKKMVKPMFSVMKQIFVTCYSITITTKLNNKFSLITT